MKFELRLKAEMLAAWKEHYVDYERLKMLLYEAQAEDNNSGWDLLEQATTQEIDKASEHFMRCLKSLVSHWNRLLNENIVRGLDDDLFRDRTPSDRSAGSSRNYGTLEDPLNNDSVTSSGLEDPLSDMLKLDTTKHGSESGDHSVADLGALDESDEIFVPDELDLKVKESSISAKKRYLKWLHVARNVSRFAEINVRSIEKLQKKARKNGGPKCADYMLQYVHQSPLRTKLPVSTDMQKKAKEDFRKHWDAHLEQFGTHQSYEESKIVWHAKWHCVGLACFAFLLILYFPYDSAVVEKYPEALRAIGLFIFCLILWVTQAVPYFCTSLLVPVIAVPLGVMQQPVCNETRHICIQQAPAQNSKLLMSVVFDYKQFLVLGGMTMAKALAKMKLEVRVANFLHRKTAHIPEAYMLGLMLSSCIVSAFVSNHASAILAISVVQPTLWVLPSESSAPKALLLGLAFAANYGGILSPIASSQNTVVANMPHMHVSFVQWFISALPLAVSGTVIAWLILLKLYRPFDTLKYIPQQLVRQDEIPGQAASDGYLMPPLTRDAYVVLLICGGTVTLWCLPFGTLFFGDVGVISLLPVVSLFGIGILTKDDFSSLPWQLLFLISGGNMLGQCAVHSGMLEMFNEITKQYVKHTTPHQLMITGILIMAVINLFIKHTVSALVFLAFLDKIGWAVIHSHNAEGDRTTIGMMLRAAVMMTSGSMMLPFSSFPNMNSLLVEDMTGTRYLKPSHYFLPGFLATSYTMFTLCTWYPYLLSALDT